MLATVGDRPCVSYDEGATIYAALTEIQQPRVEIIESLLKMMERALGRFIEICQGVFFADSVSYNTVATAELEAIQGTS